MAEGTVRPSRHRPRQRDVIPIVVGGGIGGLIGAVFLWRLYRYLRQVRIGMIQHFEPQGVDVETVLLGEVSKAQQENRRGWILVSRVRARRAARMAARFRRDKDEM